MQPSVQHISATFEALAHPMRRDLLHRIARSSAGVVELSESFDVSLNAISKHLKVLESAGLIRRHVEGRSHRFTCEAKPVDQALSWLTNYREFWMGAMDRMKQAVERETKRHGRI